MSEVQQEQSRIGVTSLGLSEVEQILGNLRALRDQTVIAWHERGVILSHEEQERLHSEIKQTCEFLTDLTQQT